MRTQLALLDAARQGGLPRHLHDRVGSEATQGGDVAVLAVAVSDGFGAAQAQREFRGPSRYIRRRKCRYREHSRAATSARKKISTRRVGVGNPCGDPALSRAA